MPCLGDADNSGVITPDDLLLIIRLLFTDEVDIELATFLRADASSDEKINAADLSATVRRQGLICPPAPSPTPTATRTGTPTATSTPTPFPTPTPTQACAVQTVGLGVTSGALTTTDCRRLFLDSLRYTDEYRFTASPDQAIRIAVTATGGDFSPYIRVVDSNGYFGDAAGASPIELTATTSLPYTIFVTSQPGHAAQTGSYEMTLSMRPCTVEPLRTRVTSLDGSECPDPGSPSVGSRQELADLYAFSIEQPLTSVEIIMRQSVEDSLLDPVLYVYGPDGYEVFPSFQADDAAPGGFGFDARARFLATQTGRYIVVASGGGCNPAEPGANCRYALTFRTASCPSVSLDPLPGTSRKVAAGALHGDPRRTACPAPLSMPGFNEFGEPEVNSVADVYTFTGAEGDVISAEMISEGEPQLSLFGPALAGNPFLAFNDTVAGDVASQLAATLPQAGTYTVLVGNRTFLEPPDPNDPGDEGDFVEYEAFFQLCPLGGGLSPSTGSAANSRFRPTDCVGFGDYPFHSFAFDGDRGEVITATLRSQAVDPALRVLGADRSEGGNDNDPLAASLNARLIRTLSSSGEYFVEVSTSREDIEPDLSEAPAYSVAVRSCPVKPAAIGTLAESFSDADCDLGGGRRYDAYTFDGVAGLPPRPFVVSVAPPAGACALGLLPEGGQLLREACSDDVLEMPVVGQGTAGFVIASNADQRGPYTASVRTCALPSVGLGGVYSGSLAAAGCTDARGTRADWILFRDRAGLVRFNAGAIFALSADFATAAVVTGAVRRIPLLHRRGLDAGEAIPLAGELGALIKIRGATASDRGAYVLQVAPPVRRQ